jgi:hypothetical protein
MRPVSNREIGHALARDKDWKVKGPHCSAISRLSFARDFDVENHDHDDIVSIIARVRSDSSTFRLPISTCLTLQSRTMPDFF